MWRSSDDQFLHRRAAVLANPAINEPSSIHFEMEVSAKRKRSAASIVESAHIRQGLRIPRLHFPYGRRISTAEFFFVAGTPEYLRYKIASSMNVSVEIQRLQQHLDKLAQAPDDTLLERYTMHQPRRPPGFYWQLRWLAGQTLRWLESHRLLRSEPWPVSLRHASTNRTAKPLLIWGVGVDRITLREKCNGFSNLLGTLPDFAPVLVTNEADFAFFSRLGWLVEYLPSIAGQDELFPHRKARFLARLYRGAPAIPASIGTVTGPQADEVRRLILRNS
jgi:hypothetical protein